MTEHIIINMDNIYNDEYEENTTNNCVICFEPVTNATEISKFGCIHSKNMHNDCVKSLRKCPLCRETAIIVYKPKCYVINKEKLCYFIIGIVFCGVIFIASYPLYMYSIGFGNYRNSTVVDSIVNSTVVDNTIY